MKRSAPTQKPQKAIVTNRHFKGVWIPKLIWENKDLSWVEKVFLIEIDSLDGNDGCFASNKYFSEFFGLTPGRCTQIIKALQTKEYLSSELIYEGKQVVKRILRVHSFLSRVHRKVGGGYIEKYEDNNTKSNNTKQHKKLNTKKPDKPTDPNQKTFLSISKQLAKIVESKKNINISSSQIKSWTKPIAKLFNDHLNGSSFPVKLNRVEDVLDYYAQQGTPSQDKFAIVAESGTSFLEKFTKFEGAMDRHGFDRTEPDISPEDAAEERAEQRRINRERFHKHYSRDHKPGELRRFLQDHPA